MPTPRVIMLSDFPPLDVIPGGGGKGPPEKLSDPDDIQSMVRFLLYTNELEVEALVASAGTFANIANKQNILDILDLYDQVDENLRQHDARYPQPDQLRAVVWQGRHKTWGKPVEEIIGEGKDTEASEAIIRIVDRPDPRPVWVGVWGGSCEVAQAIWKVQRTRSPEELQSFLGKLRIFMIGLGSKTGQDGSGQWMLDTFPDLFIIVSQKTYGGMFAQNSPLGNLEWLDANIREGHGPLGAIYPRSGFNINSPGMQEGDTPTFLHLISGLRGLNDPEQPDQESWGGQYVQRDPAKNHWYDGPGAESVRKWLPDFQADFAKRADWMLPSSVTAASTAAGTNALIIEAESGAFSGWVDRHCCWHNVMLTDEPHSTHSGEGLVDTPNKVGSYIEVAYDALWSGPHRITVRYTHIKPDPRRGQLWINGEKGPVLEMPQNKALPAYNTDSVVVDLEPGRNLLRLVALNEGGLGNVDYLKVAELREPRPSTLPRIVVLEAEDGIFQGKVDHHSCWNFIAQHPGPHTGFTGEGYVDADNKIGSFVELTFDAPNAGAYQLAARYTHGKDDTRPAEVSVNGEVVEAVLAFRPTKFWTDWVYLPLSKPVALKQGPNVIRFSATGPEGLANLDHLKITPAQ